MSRIECKWAKSFVLPHLHSIQLMWSTASELGLSSLWGSVRPMIGEGFLLVSHQCKSIPIDNFSLSKIFHIKTIVPVGNGARWRSQTSTVPPRRRTQTCVLTYSGTKWTLCNFFYMGVRSKYTSLLPSNLGLSCQSRRLPIITNSNDAMSQSGLEAERVTGV